MELVTAVLLSVAHLFNYSVSATNLSSEKMRFAVIRKRIAVCSWEKWQIPE